MRADCHVLVQAVTLMALAVTIGVSKLGRVIDNAE